MQKNPRLSIIVDHLLKQSPRIISAQLAIGELVLFSDDQIQAQWKDSSLAQSVLTIRRITAEQQCMTCFEKYYPARAEVSCPHCGSMGAKIISGEEFYLESFNE